RHLGSAPRHVPRRAPCPPRGRKHRAGQHVYLDRHLEWKRTYRQERVMATDSPAPKDARTSESREVSDLELVGQVKAGDIEAFSELVRRHEQNVYNLAYRFMREPSLAE